MKLHLLDRNGTATIQSLATKQREFLKLWHYHSEIELVYIVRGTGTLYVGDFIGQFKRDDIFLFGSNLPHMFDSDPDQPQDSESVTLHFDKAFLAKLARVSMEFGFITDLLNSSRHGILFQPPASKELLPLFGDLPGSGGVELYLQAINILYRLSQARKFATLGSTNWANNFNVENDRLNQVLEYIMMNFREGIDLDQISHLAGMNKSAFCRYFKQKTDRTFVNYVNGVRINYACRLLREKTTNRSVSVACYESGFNSLSYFSRIFKKHVGCSPTAYANG